MEKRGHHGKLDKKMKISDLALQEFIISRKRLNLLELAGKIKFLEATAISILQTFKETRL